MKRWLSAAVFAGLGAACSPAVRPDDAATSADATRESEATRALATCRARRADTNATRSIRALVAHINALPAPATVPCVIASLPRPFSVVATSSITSAQPAYGPRSPRLFLLFPSLTLSVVAEGQASNLIEFGEPSALHRSIKAEVELPATGAISEQAPFSRVIFQGGTSCGFCHRDEQSHSTGVFSSVALRPTNESLVSLDSLRALPAIVCESAQDTSARCLFWHALFDDGGVEQGAFDPAMETLIR